MAKANSSRGKVSRPRAGSAPAHLRRETQGWYAGVVREYELEPHHRRILETACVAWDRLCEAREAIARDGLIERDRFGQSRPHPAVAIERDSRQGFLRALRELGLDVEPPAEAPRPPKLVGTAGGR